MSKAQGTIFDILQVFGPYEGTTVELGLGQIAAETALPVLQVHRALQLLVTTGEIKARGPDHDMMSTIYSRVRA